MEPYRCNNQHGVFMVYIHPESPVVEAYVLAKGQREIALRSWELGEEGIGVWCRCEKGHRCSVDGKVYRPARAGDIVVQIRTQVEDLAREYGVSARRVDWHAVTRGEMRRQAGPVLWGDWKSEEKLALARVGYDVIYSLQFPWAGKIGLPAFARKIELHEAIEVGQLAQMAKGLLHFEGVLPRDELLDRVVKMVYPGDGYTSKRGAKILAATPALRPSTSSGLVSLKDVARPATLMKQKLELGLPPRKFTRLELLEAAGPDTPLSKDLTRIERKLRQTAGQEIDVRSIQAIVKNKPSLEAVLDELAGQYEVPEKRVEDWVKWVSRLWEQTPRYELGGRTPSEGSRT